MPSEIYNEENVLDNFQIIIEEYGIDKLFTNLPGGAIAKVVEVVNIENTKGMIEIKIQVSSYFNETGELKSKTKDFNLKLFGFRKEYKNVNNNTWKWHYYALIAVGIASIILFLALLIFFIRIW